VVDAANALGERLGYKAIPNGILLDERGVLRYRKLGDFSVERAEDVAAVERLLGAAAPDRPAPCHRLGRDPPVAGRCSAG
jgi:hypothetical protein